MRDTRWFSTGRSEAALYLSGLIGLPVAFALSAMQPLAAPEQFYGLLIAATGWPVWATVSTEATRQVRPAYSLWGLRAQVWLQLGGGTRQALIGLRDSAPSRGRHAAGPP